MHPSRTVLGSQILALEFKKSEALEAIRLEYNTKLEELKNQCTHKYDDGVPAIIEERLPYNNHRDVCAICSRVLPVYSFTLRGEEALRRGKKYPY